MPAAGSGAGGKGGGGGAGGAGAGARGREKKQKGTTKGALKHNDEQANKAPTGRTLKVIAKKAAAKARKVTRAEDKEYQEEQRQFQSNKLRGKAYEK